jgi:Transcriptional regulators, similar to M. xanthus CarD
MNPFEIGDKVVYPNHGVGIIEKISNRLVAGQKFERFYLCGFVPTIFSLWFPPQTQETSASARSSNEKMSTS